MHRMMAVLLGLFALLLLVAPAGAKATDPVKVEATVYVVNFGNYDAKQGTYVLDFYLTLTWDPKAAPDNFTASHFEFANGRATNRDLQADETDNATGLRTLYYRVQANLYSTPRYGSYPFDHQLVEMRLEDAVYPESQLVYVAGPDSGLEPGFTPANWQVSGTNYTIETHPYSFDAPYSQAHFTIEIQRSVLSGVLKVILPPIAFVLISGVSFLLLGSDKIATRFAITANMAISGIMFHAAQSSTLPSLSELIFLDRYLLSVHVFTFGSLAVTAAVALLEMKRKDPEAAKRTNWTGAGVAAAAAVGAFLLLQLV